ncbi:MAG: carboxypeptidase regulatory-like domain-containing protein, partial [Methylococcales bacterium]
MKITHKKIITPRLFQYFLSMIYLLCILFVPRVFAGQDEGIQWLSTQAQNAGNYSSVDDLSTKEQSTGETLLSFHQLEYTEQASIPALEYLNQSMPLSLQTTEVLSRLLIVRKLSGQTFNEILGELVQRINDDGGLGDLLGYESTNIDTAFFLEAGAYFEVTSELTNTLRPSIEYLLNNQQSNGGWMDGDNESSVYLTSVVMRTLWHFQKFAPPISPALRNAQDFLLSQRAEKALWNKTFESALALIALIPYISDNSLIADSLDTLLTLQSASGSWDNDTYTTALALRTLSLYDSLHNISDNIEVTIPDFAENPILIQEDGSISGIVIDANTQTPISAAKIYLYDTSIPAVASSIDGYFSIADLPPQNYTLIIESPTYTISSKIIVINAEKLSNIGQIHLIPINSPTPIISKLALHTNIMGGLNNAPINGAEVVIKGTTISQLTDASGMATFNDIETKTFQLTVSAQGYQVTDYNVIAPSFGELNLNLILPPLGGNSQATKTQLSGQLRDNNNLPISNGFLQVSGTTHKATTDENGFYQINEIEPLHFTLVASAGGYHGAKVEVHLGVYGEYEQNIQLPLLPIETNDPTPNLTSSHFQIINLYSQKNEVKPYSTITFTANIKNMSNLDGNISLRAEVVNANNEAVSSADITMANGSGAWHLLLQGEADSQININWESQRWLAGQYQLNFYIVEPNSNSIDLPLGKVFADANINFTVIPGKAIDGRLALEPPMAQSGMNEPVQLSVLLMNEGNVSLVNTPLELTITHPDDNRVLHTSQKTITDLASGQFTSLSFGGWIPTVSGDLNLHITAQDNSVQGSIEGHLYVGNKASGLFTANKTFVPPGNNTAIGHIEISGVNVAQAVVDDPLFFAVQNAVETGGDYTVKEATRWHRSTPCSGCHVQTQSLMGLASSLGKANVDRDAARFLSNTITGGQVSSGAFQLHTANSFSYLISQTVLGSWALNAWQSPEQEIIMPSIYKAMQYLNKSKRETNDMVYWRPYLNSNARQWFYTDNNMTATAITAMSHFIKNSETLDNKVKSYHFNTILDLFDYRRITDIEIDKSTGFFYLLIEESDSRIIKMNPTFNSIEVIAQGLPTKSRSLARATDGTLYTLHENGYIEQILPNGQRHSLFLNKNLSKSDITIGKGNFLYISLHSESKIIRINTENDFGENSQIETILVRTNNNNFNRPMGLTINEAGDLYIGMQTSNHVYAIGKLAADGIFSIVSDGFPHEIRWLAYGDENTLYASLGLLTYRYYGPVGSSYGLYHIDISTGLIDRITETQYQGIAYANGQLWGLEQQSKYLTQIQATTKDITAEIDEFKTTIAAAARYLLSNRSNSGVYNVPHAQTIIGLSEAATVISDPQLLSQIQEAINEEVALLRERQNEIENNLGEAQGGWSSSENWKSQSDPLVTAMVGMALDYTNPSADDPVIRKAIRFLLASQQGDGSWNNVRNWFSTKLAATSFVVAYLPKALARLGGIDAELNLVFNQTVNPENFTVSPDSSQTLAEGKTQYTWHFTGVTEQGQYLDFDTALPNMQIGEKRPLTEQAYLNFKNSFTNKTLRLDLEIPVIRADSNLTLSASIDKAIYTANETMLVDVEIKNTSTASSLPATLRYTILDATGEQVTVLTQTNIDSLNANANFATQTNWNTGTLLTGNYQLEAALIDVQGDIATQQILDFTIQNDNTQMLTLSSHTDRTIYHSTDNTLIVQTLNNPSPNHLY